MKYAGKSKVLNTLKTTRKLLTTLQLYSKIKSHNNKSGLDPINFVLWNIHFHYSELKKLAPKKWNNYCGRRLLDIYVASRHIAVLIKCVHHFSMETSRGDGTDEISDMGGIYKHRPIVEL